MTGIQPIQPFVAVLAAVDGQGIECWVNYTGQTARDEPAPHWLSGAGEFQIERMFGIVRVRTQMKGELIDC